MRLLFCLAFVLTLGGCVLEEPPGPAPTPVSVNAEDTYRIASWNVRNLFDDVDDAYKDEVPTPKEYEQKLMELSEVLNTLEADFVALQEVENLRSLEELNKRLERPYPQLGLIEGNDQIRGIDVCFLSRLPVKKVFSHKSHRLPLVSGSSKQHGFSRDCLEVQLATQPPVTVLVNHFKSARGDAKKSANKRRAQSAGVVEIAQEVDTPGRAILIVGDLNGPGESWALEPLFQNYTDAFSLVPKAERITHRFRGGGSALDHILLDSEAEQIIGERKIWEGVANHTSDHNPVTAEFRLRAADSGSVPVKTWSESD